MGLFNDLSKYKKPSKEREVKREKPPTLIELAEEKFGENRRLMMWIESFLDQKRTKHLLPTRQAWIQQLALLEEYPENERERQVRRSITYDYRALAYEYKGKKQIKQKDEYQKEDEINYAHGF